MRLEPLSPACTPSQLSEPRNSRTLEEETSTSARMNPLAKGLAERRWDCFEEKLVEALSAVWT